MIKERCVKILRGLRFDEGRIVIFKNSLKRMDTVASLCTHSGNHGKLITFSHALH